MLAVAVYILVFGSIGLLVYVSMPFILEKMGLLRQKGGQDSFTQSEEARVQKKKITLLYIACPLMGGLVGWAIFLKPFGIVVGVILGFILPSFLVKMMLARRLAKFNQQLIDGLMILSSCLRGGLSFLQSLEVLCEEMPPPISEEFSLVVREIKMGLTIDVALERLSKRVSSEELELFISSVLVSRETGGDLTKVFSRLISTIRERNRLKEAVATYTLQGKIQGLIMSILPIAFFVWVQRVNPQHFDVMMQTSVGRMILIIAVVLEIVALFLIKKFSTIKV